MAAEPRHPFGRRDQRVAYATAAAAALVAQQVLGKALRDTLFLSAFGIDYLPYAMTGAALVSGVLILGLSRAALAFSPRRITRATLVASACLYLLAWALAGRSPRAAAVVIYLQAGALSAASASVFWSLVSECFDPYAARSSLPRIMAGATLGGFVGGLATWAASAWLAPHDLLPMGALLSLAALAAIWRMPRGAGRSSAPGTEGWRDVFGALPYLRVLGLFVISAALTQAVLDYLLSSAAVSSLGQGPPLLSFFALFQTGVGMLSFLVQIRLSRRALERFGVGAALCASPFLSLAGIAVSFLGPPLLGAALVRGTDGVLGASIHRSAYEVLFAPLDARRRRAWKPLLDVLGDRIGMMLGSGIAAAVVAMAPGHARPALLLVVAAFAVVRVILSARLQAGYRHTLADNLRGGGLGLASAGVLDRGTVGALSQAAELDRGRILDEVARFQAEVARAPARDSELSVAAFDLPPGPVLDAGQAPGPAAATPTVRADTLLALAELGSGDAGRARAALRQRSTAPLLAAQVVSLLSDDRLARDAADWLLAQQPPPIGLLTDALLDEGSSMAGRRRVARILGKLDDGRAAEGLLAALPAVPAGVRPGLAQALARAAARRPLPREPLLAAAARAAREGGNGTDLQDTFRLLAAAYPGEPVHAAFRALERGAAERGTALEWLDVVLPDEVKAALWPRIVREGERAVTRPRAAEELRRALGRVGLRGDQEDPGSDGP